MARAHPSAGSRTRRLAARTKRPLGLAVIEGGAVTGCAVEGWDGAPAALFQVGSVSKSVAAAVALRLSQLGSIDLDTNVNEYLTSWQLPGDGVTTTRSLLGHTAGATVPFFPGYAQGDSVPSVLQVLDGTAPANTGPVRVEPRSAGAFCYSGGAFVVVQQLVADVTGTSFAEAARTLLLAPLGMSSSTFEEPLPAGRRSAAVISDWHVYPEAAAAGLWTTPEDLAKFVCALLAAGAGGSSPLDGVGTEMLRPHAPLAANGEWNLLPLLGVRPPHAVGLGLFLHDAGRFSHAGGASSFFCMFTGSVADGSGGVVMLAGRASPYPFAVLRAMSRDHGWCGFDLPWWQRPSGLPGLRRLARPRRRTLVPSP
jgi:CubicO group peptidase (beta-lactamase class C family)